MHICVASGFTDAMVSLRVNDPLPKKNLVIDLPNLNSWSLFMQQDPGVKELFKEIDSYRRAWAQKTQLWEESQWQCPESNTLEHNCYETVGGKGSDVSPENQNPQIKRALRLRSKSSEAFASTPKALGGETTDGPQTPDAPNDILLNEDQRKELADVLASIAALEKSDQSGSQKGFV